MNQQQTYGRRHFLCSSAALAGVGLLQACVSNNKEVVNTQSTPTVKPPQRAQGNQNLLRVFASSGFGENSSRSELALRRLADAGFLITNQEACFRRAQRFAGSDMERAADLQAVANGQVPTPKVLMGLRGGYGSIRLLPYVNWEQLGSRMRDQGTLLFGYSDVTAIQLALLAKGKMCSFAGPMVYSEFGTAQPSVYTLQSFVDNTTNNRIEVNVNDIQDKTVNAQGILWGGNLSTLASLVGTAYFPDINGGILFIEDVAEQPYRIERMLQTLYLNGVLQRQQAIIMGQFRMGDIHDVYDRSYTLGSVIQAVSRQAKVPVLTGFPFGHVTNKITFPLGAMARVETMSNGGFQVSFSDYPVLDKTVLSLDNLLPPPPPVENDPIATAATTEGDLPAAISASAPTMP